jgi:hypothetical protein
MKGSSPNMSRTKTRRDAAPTPVIDHARNTWSVKMAAKWAGVPERTLYRMLRDGLVPCIPLGDVQVQKLAAAKSGKRKRQCSRFVIPRVSFMKAWENVGSAGDLSNTTAA